MTSAWKPPRTGTDQRGNITLTAYDGTEIVVQRRDIPDLIRALEAERDRFKSIDPKNGIQPIDVADSTDSSDDPEDTKPE